MFHESGSTGCLARCRTRRRRREDLFGVWQTIGNDGTAKLRDYGLDGNGGAMFAGLHANHGKSWDAKLIWGLNRHRFGPRLRAAEASEMFDGARARRTTPLYCDDMPARLPDTLHPNLQRKEAAAKTATAATAKAAQDAAKTAQDEYNTAKGNAADITEKTLKDAFEDNFRTDLDNKVDAAQKAADALTAEDAPNPDAAEKDWDDAIDHWKELDKEKTEAETEKNKKDFEVTRLTNQVKDAQTTVNDRIQDIADNGTATETQKNLLGEVNGSLTTERDLLKIEKGVKKGLEDSRNELTGLRDDLNASVAATNGWNNTSIVVGSMGTNKDLNFGTHKASDIQKAFDNPKGPEFNAIYQAALGLYNDPALAKNVPLRKLRRY